MYSTDTEEQILSVDQGIDRCAAILKVLKEQQKENFIMEKATRQQKLIPPLKRGSRPTKCGPREEKRNCGDSKKKGVHSSPTTPPNERHRHPDQEHLHHKPPKQTNCENHYQEGDYHQHRHHIRPTACSTPNIKPSTRHTRTLTQPETTNPVDGTFSSASLLGIKELVGNSGTFDRDHKRYNHRRRHRRFKSEPGKVILGILSNGNGKQGTKPPVTSQKHQPMVTDNTSSLPTNHPPPPPPPMFHPYYYHPYPYLLPYNYPHHIPVNWSQEPIKNTPNTVSHSKSQTEALDLATLHHPFRFTSASLGGYYHGYCWDLPPNHKGSTWRGRDKTKKQVSNLESFDGLLCEMLNSCEESVEKMKFECENFHTTVQLQKLQQILGHCKEELCQQYKELVQDKKLSSSAMNRHLQVQQLKQEKTELIEKIKESCSAYSELKCTLDEQEKQINEQDNELKEKRKQVSILQQELNVATQTLDQRVATLKTTEEELANIKDSAYSTNAELKERNTALQQQIHLLFGVVSRAKKDNESMKKQISQIKFVLEASKEEEAMLRVTVSEKNAQLVQRQDQLLGMRQCLAHFLSEFSKFESNLLNGDMYSVSKSAVKKLRSLADDGSIENFLVSYKNDRSLTSSNSDSFKVAQPPSEISLEADGIIPDVITPVGSHHQLVSSYGNAVGPKSASDSPKSSSNSPSKPLKLIVNERLVEGSSFKDHFSPPECTEDPSLRQRKLVDHQTPVSGPQKDTPKQSSKRPVHNLSWKGKNPSKVSIKNEEPHSSANRRNKRSASKKAKPYTTPDKKFSRGLKRCECLYSGGQSLDKQSDYAQDKKILKIRRRNIREEDTPEQYNQSEAYTHTLDMEFQEPLKATSSRRNTEIQTNQTHGISRSGNTDVLELQSNNSLEILQRQRNSLNRRNTELLNLDNSNFPSTSSAQHNMTELLDMGNNNSLNTRGMTEFSNLDNNPSASARCTTELLDNGNFPSISSVRRGTELLDLGNSSSPNISDKINLQRDGCDTSLKCNIQLTSSTSMPVKKDPNSLPFKTTSSISLTDLSNTTTPSEIDFRNSLANLDANLARLQLNFKIASNQ